MKRKILKFEFFGRSAPEVARDLLGKFLVRRRRGREESFMILETEAYDGYKDRGSHASRGKTIRNAPMFGPAGHFYVYFTYGVHWMLNIVTGPEDYPSAVLIRGVKNISGPARLTKKLGIDKKFNNRSANKKTGLWFEDGEIKIFPRQIKKGPRVGINYAGSFWKKRHWRFWIVK